MSGYVGDFPVNGTVQLRYDTFAIAGESITRSTNGSLRVFKDGSDTQRSSGAGITDTEDFDTLTGHHLVSLDLSDNTDAGFYAAGSEYHVVLVGAVVDTKTVNKTIGSFSIQNRYQNGAIKTVDLAFNKDSTSQGPFIDIESVKGGPLTGLVFNSSGLTGYYLRQGGSPVPITLATLAAINSAFSSGGFKEADATNMPGSYRLDIPDLALATGADYVQIVLKGAANMQQTNINIALLDPVALTGDRVRVALADYFLSDSGHVYADAINGSVVKELAVNAAAAAIAAMNDLSPAEVADEIAAALLTDANAELVGPPAANAPLADKLNWVYHLMRHKLVTTSSGISVKDSSGVELATAATSYAAGTATRDTYVP